MPKIMKAWKKSAYANRRVGKVKKKTPKQQSLMSQSLMMPKQMKLPVHSLTRSSNLGRSGLWMTAVLFLCFAKCKSVIVSKLLILTCSPFSPFRPRWPAPPSWTSCNTYQQQRTCYNTTCKMRPVYTWSVHTQADHAAWRRFSHLRLQIHLTQQSCSLSWVESEDAQHCPKHIHAYGEIHARYVANITVIPTFWSSVINTQPAH